MQNLMISFRDYRLKSLDPIITYEKSIITKEGIEL